MFNYEFNKNSIIINDKYKIFINSELIVDNDEKNAKCEIKPFIIYTIYEFNNYINSFNSLKNAIDYCKDLIENF